MHSDGFMNHSCDPNCWCPLVSRTPNFMCYDAIAEMDIHPGDEITCDYSLFDYECDGHAIEQCGCGAAICRGKMLGFKALGLQEQVRIMHKCEEEILEQFYEDNPNLVILESVLPEGVSFVHEASKWTSLVATRKFEEGEVVYKNAAAIIPMDHIKNKKYVVKIDGTYILLNPEDHFIHRPAYAEFLGYDSFQDHACEPNTVQEYHDSVSYTVRAARTISPGDVLSIDYGKLENQADGIELVPSSTFTCNCGSKLCRGVIIA
jgi:SET domain